VPIITLIQIPYPCVSGRVTRKQRLFKKNTVPLAQDVFALYFSGGSAFAGTNSPGACCELFLNPCNPTVCENREALRQASPKLFGLQITRGRGVDLSRPNRRCQVGSFVLPAFSGLEATESSCAFC
jgi:hypothetical protein